MKKKNNVILILQIVGVFLLVIGLVYFVYNKIKQEYFKNVNQELKEVINNIDNKTSSPKEEIIKKKLGLLLDGKYDLPLDSYQYDKYLIELFQKGTFNNELLAYKLLNNTSVDDDFDENKITDKYIKDIVDTFSLAHGVIHKNDYLNTYYSLFGNKNAPLPTLIDNCPNYYYDKDNEIYIIVYECGVINPEEVLTYINKIDVNDDFAYVYINVGYLAVNETSEKNVIYSDITKEQANVIDYVDLYDYSYKIDSNNYNKFSEYKITFKNISGDYYFDKIEKNK